MIRAQAGRAAAQRVSPPGGEDKQRRQLGSRRQEKKDCVSIQEEVV